jgi:hypothetical protein
MSTLYLRYVWEHAISDTKSFHTAWSHYYKRRNLRRRNLLNPTWANNCLDVKYWLGLPVEILDLCERLRSKFYPLFRKLCVVRVNQSACLAFCANDKRNEPNDKMRMIKILPLDENFERTLYVLFIPWTIYTMNKLSLVGMQLPENIIYKENFDVSSEGPGF